MADELPEVEQRFIADMADYLAKLQEAIDEARRFADASREASGAINDIRDHAAEAAHELGDYRDKAAEADHADDGLRDSALEAGAALGHVRDEALLAAAALERMHDESSTPLKDVSHGLGDVAKAAEDAAGAIGGGGGGTGGIGGLVGSLFSGSMSMWALAAPAAFLAAVLLGPMISGLFAVTASIGALGIVAIPVFKDISAFFTATSASQRKAAWKAMDPAEQGITKHLEELKTTFDKITKAVEPSIVQMFGDALKVVDALMPSLKPLAEGAAKAFGSFFNQIAAWLNGPSGKKFLQWLDTEGPKAMKTFTDALWITMQVIGRVFDFLRNAGDAWFKHFGEGVSAVHHGFDEMRHTAADWAHNTASYFDVTRHNIASWAHETASNFDDVRHNIATWAHDAANDFDTVRHNIASWAHDLASYFDEARANIARWVADVGRDVTDVVNWFRRLPGEILSALGNLGSLLVNIGISIMDGLLHGLESGFNTVKGWLSNVGGWIASLKGPIDKDAVLLYPHGQAIIGGLMHGMQSALPALQALLGDITGMVGLRGPTTGNLALAGVGSRGGAAAVGAPVNVTVPVTASAVASPEFLHGLQQIIQEAVLRYVLNNQGNGMFLPGKLAF